ncbi:FG-GAP-like repeat-containing protein [Microbulbifer sp. JMSA003]|uniref:FG-GAP-like repeat-containing protein n=1 Tax=Microbulbifer sp. JMSA003 TaxID=3243369 RepID=UPI00403A198B
MRGLNFSHLQQSKGVTALEETMGSGLCVLDVNNDSYPDLFAVGGGGHTRYYGKESWWASRSGSHLYINNGMGYFTDSTNLLNLPQNLKGMGCNAADLDKDRRTDLILTTRNGIYLLYNRDTGFETKVLYQSEESWPTSVTIADINNDDLTDIYVSNYIKYDKTAKHFESLSGYRQASDSHFQANFYQGLPNLLFVNQDGVNFQESASQFNLADNEGRSLSSHWFYANNDEFIDLLIVNDLGSTTKLYLNDDGRIFKKANLSHNLDLPSGTRSAAFNDINNDGHLDIALSTIHNENPIILMGKDGTFINATWDKILNPTHVTGMSSFGTALLDANNDGLIDLIFSNGFPHPDSDSPYIPQGQKNILLLNTGSNFISETEYNTSFSSYLSSRSIVTADFDSDGDHDFAVSNNNGPLQLYINKTKNSSWVGFDLNKAEPHDIVKITIETNKRVLNRFPNPSAFLGKNEDKIIFSLENDERIIKSLIHWSDDSSTEFVGVQGNSYHQIKGRKIIKSYPAVTPTQKKREPARLFLWKVIGNATDYSNIASIFNTYSTKTKVKILDSIGSNRDLTYLPIIQAGLKDKSPNIVIKSIELLIKLESDNVLHWLEPLFQEEDPKLLCALANGYHYLYLEEEAAILRKSQAITKLIRLLEHHSPKVQACSLNALSESKSPRAVYPVMQLLNKTNEKLVIKHALQALGELRRSYSASSLIRASEKNILNQEIDLALDKSKGRLQHINDPTSINLTKNILSTSLGRGSKAVTNCPKIDTTKIANMHEKQIARLFNSCGNSQVLQWAKDHIEFVKSSYPIFLDNQSLKDSVLQSILTGISSTPPSGFTDILNKKLSQHYRVKPILHSLTNFQLNSSTYTILEEIFIDRTRSVELRLLAGDILIHKNSKLVLSLADELFYEK